MIEINKIYIVVDETRNIIRYKKILLIGGIHYAVFRLFFIFTNATTASTALIKHKNDQINKSPYLPAPVNPNKAAKPNNTTNAILPPFLTLFLTQIETIPPASKRIATNNPALPPASPFADIVLATPANADWNNTNTLNTIDNIPETNFQVFMIKFSLQNIYINTIKCVYLHLIHIINNNIKIRVYNSPTCENIQYIYIVYARIYLFAHE